MKTLMLAWIDPAALPALRVAGALFIIINLLAGAYLVRHWRAMFGPDVVVGDDVKAVRYLRIIVIAAPLLILTFRLLMMWVGLWTTQN